MPEPYVREPTDFIPDSEDTSAAASREVTQANISQNNDTKAQQRPKVVSLVCRAHEGQLSAAPYSIKPTQLVCIKYLIVSLVCRAHEGQLSAAPYSIKSTQLVCIKYLIVSHVCRAHEGQLSAAPYSIKPTQLVSLTLKAPIATKVVCFSGLLKC